MPRRIRKRTGVAYGYRREGIEGQDKTDAPNNAGKIAPGYKSRKNAVQTEHHQDVGNIRIGNMGEEFVFERHIDRFHFGTLSQLDLAGADFNCLAVNSVKKISGVFRHHIYHVQILGFVCCNEALSRTAFTAHSAFRPSCLPGSVHRPRHPAGPSSS